MGGTILEGSGESGNEENELGLELIPRCGVMLVLSRPLSLCVAIEIQLGTRLCMFYVLRGSSCSHYYHCHCF